MFVLYHNYCVCIKRIQNVCASLNRVCVYLELLVLGVEVVSSLLQLSDLTVQPGHHCLPVVPQLPVPLLLHVQTLPQRQDVHTLQVQLVLLHTHTRIHTDAQAECAQDFLNV